MKTSIRSFLGLLILAMASCASNQVTLEVRSELFEHGPKRLNRLNVKRVRAIARGEH